VRSRRKREGPFEGKATCVVLFHSTNFAIRAEKLAKEMGLTMKLIPIPRHLSSDCGVCLLHLASERDAVVEMLERNRVEYDSLELL
jgi:hypothetical protein